MARKTSLHDPVMWRRQLQEDATRLGFSAMAITRHDAIPVAAERLAEFISAGHHGTMTWMADTIERRSKPGNLWPDVRSIIVLAMNYGPHSDPLAVVGKPKCGAISVYARNRDYHDIIKGRLKEIAQRFAAASGAEVKVFVDTAPVMEKPLAAAAGIGWQGKHTNLVSRKDGSWLFLGSIFSTVDLPADEPETDHCGTCRACLDICPTDAFPAPYRLDARRCISYLTIEHKTAIPVEFRVAMGNRIFGCDDCLAICPWNKFAASSKEAKLQARPDLDEPDLAMLLGLDDTAFRALFSGSPVKRIGRNRFMRNVLIAAGNSAQSGLAGLCTAHLSDPDPLVRGAAVWALAHLLPATDFDALRNANLAGEKDNTVRQEWDALKGDWQ